MNEDSMKQGTGSDPFSDGESTDEEQNNDQTEQQSKQASSDSGSTTGQESPTTTTRELGEIGDIDVEAESIVDEIPHGDHDVPLLLMRENVKSSRNGNTLQVHMYEETEQLVVEAEKAVRNSFDDKVRKMDINEALVIAAMANLDDVCRVLEVWGYDQEIGL